MANPISAADKGKGRAIEPELRVERLSLLESEREREHVPEPVVVEPEPVHASPVPETTAIADSPADTLPGHLERFSLSSPTRTPTPPPAPEDEEEEEEEWVLKLMQWPPLPPSPSGTAPLAGPTIGIITQNRNGPCSLIALCASSPLLSWVNTTKKKRKADGTRAQQATSSSCAVTLSCSRTDGA